MLSKAGPRLALEADTTALATSPAGSIWVTNSLSRGLPRLPLGPMRGNPPRPAPPRLRLPLGPMRGNPPRPAPPRLRLPLGPMRGNPPRPAPPRLRLPLGQPQFLDDEHRIDRQRVHGRQFLQRGVGILEPVAGHRTHHGRTPGHPAVVNGLEQSGDAGRGCGLDEDALAL